MYAAVNGEAYERSGDGTAKGLSLLAFGCILLVISAGSTASKAAGLTLTPSELN
ncbi:MAG: hypothetical protein QOJ04_2637, partial [Caballeronia sp.]|nr:hypothetical protein [Caballeronia sp.]